MKLGGWARIGIVISIVWSVVVFSYAIAEYRLMALESSEIAMAPDDPYHGLGIPVPSMKALFFEWKNNEAADFNLNATFLSITWLTPIFMLWVVPVVSVKTFKWVKEGFSSNDHS